MSTFSANEFVLVAAVLDCLVLFRNVVRILLLVFCCFTTAYLTFLGERFFNVRRLDEQATVCVLRNFNVILHVVRN